MSTDTLRSHALSWLAVTLAFLLGLIEFGALLRAHCCAAVLERGDGVRRG